MRHLLRVLAWLIPAATTLAAPVIDQSHTITQSTGASIIYAGNSPAQLFTVGASGLLSKVDVLMQRDGGDIGNLALELWPVVAGGPAGSTPLFSVPINPASIPTTSPVFVPVDVTAGQLFVSPGDQFAIAVSGTADLSAPNAAWGGGYPGYNAGDRFDRSGVWETAASDTDYGFRTWVDADVLPGGIPTLERTPTSEWDASLSMSGASVIFSAGDSMRVDRAPTFDEDERGLMEFDLSGLPQGATIQSATLEFEINQRSQSGSVVPIVAAYGYQADGSPTDADARNLSRHLGQSAPILNFDPVSISLNVEEITSMLATSSQVGIIAYGAAPNVGVSIVASQLANQSPTVYSPPTLTIGYSIPSQPAQNLPPGDYNADAHVDAADYVVWRKLNGTQGDSPADGDGDGDVDQADHGVWTGQYGVGPDDEVRNGDFETNSLSSWNVVVEPNTNVSFGFPRVESFDVDGDGQASRAMRVRLGRSDTDLFGGVVAIEQQLLLEAGDYVFSADVASQSLETFGNTGPGNYELSFDGQIVDQVMLNGTLIESLAVIRDSLEATLTNVEAGYHTLRLAVARGATNSRAIYQFIDDIQLTPVGLASTHTVPEPTAAALLGIVLASTACRRRRPRLYASRNNVGR
jgi:hypothetical protein